MRWESDLEPNYCKKVSNSVSFFCFCPAAKFCDDFETYRNSLILFPLSVQVPCVSGWFWQTMFWLESKNLVCQNQPETQRTCIDSGKKKRICKNLKITTNRWPKEKKQKRSHRGTLSCNRCVLCHFLFSFFYSTVHFFNPIVHFFILFFCLFVQTRMQSEIAAEQMNNRITKLNGRK